MNQLSTNQPFQATGKPLDRVGKALSRAVISQISPKMLGALLLPFMVALLGAVLLLWLFWTPLKEQIALWLDQLGIIDSHADLWLVGMGLFAIKTVVVPLLAAGALLPLAGILGLIVSAVMVMPLVLSYVQNKHHPQLKKQGKNAFTYSVGNALWVGVLFIVGWLFTLPLWLIAPLALVLPVFWWTFAFTRLLRVDSMVEHASAAERAVLLKRYRLDYWLLGLCMAVLNLLPPAWLFIPVFSALAFAHFNLEALQSLRAENTLDMEEL